MQRTPENLRWMIERLTDFAHLQGYPPNDNCLKAIANCYLDIIGYTPYVKPNPGQEEGVFVRDAKGFVVKHVETPETVIDHPSFPDGVKPAYWLIEKLLQTCERRFPTPPIARAMYLRKFPAADQGTTGPTEGERDVVDGL